MKFVKILLFIILVPIYVPAYVLMHYTFSWWTKLLDN